MGIVNFYITINGTTITNHPPVITILLVVGLPFPVKGGLWHCFSHINGFIDSRLLAGIISMNSG